MTLIFCIIIICSSNINFIFMANVMIYLVTLENYFYDVTNKNIY